MPSVRRSWFTLVMPALVALLASPSCDIDRLLEEAVPPEINIAITVERTVVTVAPGTSASISASVNRLGGYTGPVDVTLANVPDGIVATVGAPTAAGAVITVEVTFSVPATFAAGSYFVLVRGAAGATGRAAQSVELRVAKPPGVGLTPMAPSVAVSAGGLVPVDVAVTRSDYADPVSLSIEAPQGMSADPVVADGATGRLVVAVPAGVAPGSYPITVRARGAGIVDAAANLTVVVTADALQVIGGNVTALQATVANLEVFVNRAPTAGAVTLVGDGLPQGVSATFTPSSADDRRVQTRLSVGPSVTPGTYTFAIRATATGGATATANAGLVVGASSVTLTLVPAAVTVLQGSSAASLITLVRTSFTAPVAIDILDLPAGLSADAAEDSVTGASTTVLVSAARQLNPGVYSLRVRASPAPANPGWPALEPAVATMVVNVVEAPSLDGNVVLDWSRCSPPDWVGAQDGTGPWTTLSGVQGRFRFAVTSPRGGFAYVESGRQVTVRYATATELSAAPIDLCPTIIDQSTHSVTATAVHASATEQFTWRLGGGVGISTLATPTFTISGIREGTHDLVGYGVTQSLGLRMSLVRDVNQPAGAFLGTVSLLDATSFTPATGSLVVSGYSGEQPSVTMSYLTTAACTANQLAESSASSPVFGSATWTIRGVPTLWQRPGDYHLVDVTATSSFGSRTVSVAFHGLAATRNVALPPALSPALFALAGSHLRLRAFFSAPPAGYNGDLTLRYAVGALSVAVSTSAAAAGTSTVLLDMPDFGAVAGFPLSAVAPPGSHGTWTLTADGSNGSATFCSEGASRWSATRRGGF